MKKVLFTLILVFLSIAINAAPEFGDHYYVVKHKKHSSVTTYELSKQKDFSSLEIEMEAGDIIYGAIWENSEMEAYYHYAPDASSTVSGGGSAHCIRIDEKMNLDNGITVNVSGKYTINFNEDTQTLSWTVEEITEAGVIESGSCGANVNYVLYNFGTLVISGSGDMDSYNKSATSSIPWYSKRNYIKRVKIEDGVRTIGNYAFYNCTYLASVLIANSVTSVGNNTFQNCYGLSSVTISNSVTSIGDNVFYSCLRLNFVTIPNSVTSIGTNAFSGCCGLSSVMIPSSVTSIGDSAFSSCTGLSSIIIPNSVTSIGNRVFSGCSGLTSIMIPNSVTSIGSSAFSSCSSLTSIMIPSSVTSIGNSAFYACNGLAFVTLESSANIYDYAFGAIPLQKFCCNAESVPMVSSMAFKNMSGSTSSANNAILYVPTEMITAYRSAVSWKEFGTITSVEVEKQVNQFKADNITILSKSIGNVAVADLDAINKALEDYSILSEVVKAELSSEKSLLDNLKSKAEEIKTEEDADAAATEEVSKLKTDYATILSKQTSTVKSSDLDAINKALDDYSKLSEAAKAKFIEEKALLDALKTKAEELKAAEEYETLEQCAEPQIAFSDKTLAFSCATPDAEIHYSYYLSNVGTVKSTVQITAETKTTNAITVIAYATADNYKTSKTVIQTFPFDATVHDINGDNKVTIADVTTLIDIIVNK